MRVAVLKGGSYLCAPDYCMRYRPQARIGQSLGLGVCHGDLVLRTCDDDANWLRSLVAEFVAQLPIDEDGAALLELGVSNLDTSLRQVVGVSQIWVQVPIC